MTQQTTVEELQAKFDALKGDFHAQETAVEARQKEQTKNANILEALKQELSELLQRTQSKLERGETLTADEYVELKQSDTGLKARIEYYEALAEDLENLVYNERKKLLDIQRKTIVIRSELTEKIAEQKFIDFFKKNGAELQEIFNLFCITGNYGGYTKEFDYFEPTSKAVKDHLRTLLDKVLTSNYNIPEDLSVFSIYLENFEEIRPTLKHKESFNKKEKGLNALIKNLTE